MDVKGSEVEKFQKILKNLRIESIRCENLKAENGDESVRIKEEVVDEEEEEEANDEDGEVFAYLSDSNECQPTPKRQRVAPSTSKNSSSENARKRRVKIEDVVKNKQVKLWFDLRPDTCPFCNKKAKTTKHRNEHVKYCSENPDRIISRCPHCSKSFCDPYYIRKHIRTVHADLLNQSHSQNISDAFNEFELTQT